MTMDESGAVDALLARIIEIEEAMFVAVRNRGGVSDCQQRLGTFRLMRWMTHSVHEKAYLESYLRDLEAAHAHGRNLMTEKYGRMEGILHSHITPDIAALANVESMWMQDMRKRYPNIFSDGERGFSSYAISELQMVSEETLKLYSSEVEQAKVCGRNLVAERYENLFRRLGYASMDDAECRAAAKGEDAGTE